MSTNWFKNAIIYHILIDRFAGYNPGDPDQPEFLGGNLRAIIEKLDYIKALGANTIWLSPFNLSSEYHGYHITDFLKVDPRFGTEQDLKDLIDKIHEMDMKIITDFVPNHCSSQHPHFIDARKNPVSTYSRWFHFNKWPDDYLRFLSINELPKLNLDNRHAREHVINAAKYWLSFGIDGYRLDHCIGPKHKFWKIFKQEIKTDYPNCILIGEAWLMGIKFKELKTINIRKKYLYFLKSEAPEALFKEYIGELDGLLDFKFQNIIRDFVQNKFTKEKTLEKLQKHYKKFPPDFYLPTFLDNHDTDRFLFTCGNNKELLKEAAQIQFSIDQPKIIYYGTEAAMTQPKSIWDYPAHGDLQARQPMPWKNPDKDLLDFYNDLTHKSTK
jgi:cyclomaltodextrinase